MYNKIIERENIKSHYVTVTGMLDDNIQGKIYLEISSWGKKFYIDFDEYCKFVEKNGFLKTTLCNILYIYDN